jgi:hypothetical protein
MPEAKALLVKVKYNDGSEDYFAERDALVYRIGEYYVVIDHDMCEVVYGKDLLSALKEFNRDIVSAEVVEE